MKSKHHKYSFLCALLALMTILSMVMIIGTDTGWGKVEVTHQVLTSADGDEINSMLYKPKAADKDHKVPIVMICHGGNDMLEQTGTYALELARRGYAVITWDYTGCHNSDIPTGDSETAPGAISGLPSMGEKTVFNTVKSYDFVDQDKICSMGHSMGGMYTVGFAVDHPGEIYLQVNLGMNNYGSDQNQVHDFNFVNILGVADESALARSDNNVASVFQKEQYKRIVYNNYTDPADSLPDVELAKTYEVTGSDGKTYTRTAYMPASCHAYYLVTDDAVRTVIYAITSRVGLGMDPGVADYADHGFIRMHWHAKDIGFVLMLLSTVLAMYLTSSALLETEYFGKLKLKPAACAGYPKKSKLWWIFTVLLAVLPVGLYRTGILSMNKFLGMDISKIWLLAGTNNAYISWQWTLSLAMLAVFLIFHYSYGKKHGGCAAVYGFRTREDGGFDGGYIFRSFLFAVITFAAGYGVFSLISRYTQQGMHIATFMLSTVKANRSWVFIVYFLFQIPYFLTSTLAMKSVGVTDSDGSEKGFWKSVGIGSLIAMGGLFLLWLIFVLVLLNKHILIPGTYFMTERMYIYVIAILPLCIGMTIANILNLYAATKTNSIWAGLFTALLWGSWMIVSCGAIARYF